MSHLENWAKNHTYTAREVHYPETIEQLQALVAGNARVKALGTRHSFNDVADTQGDLISQERIAPVIELDTARSRVTVGGGVTYAAVSREVQVAGLALHNLASLPHISVAGAVATATHGSGDGNPCLAAAVSGVELVRADGEIVSFTRDRDPERFPGTVVSIGALGIVTKLTLDLEPTFTVRQDVYEDLPFAELFANFETITSSAYSVSLFTAWRGDRVKLFWLKERVRDGETIVREPNWFGATLATAEVNPVPGMPAINATPQQGVPGPWAERLAHFRAEFLPSSGEELQTEYLVPRPNAVAALKAIAGMQERIAPHLQISEIRTIAADDLWLSPFYRQACVGIHFTWKKDWPAVQELLPQIEAALLPLGARPHWGKLFAVSGAPLAALYPRLPDFRQLRSQLDPEGKFRNRYLDAFLA